jgi:PAS domain S-box-containing protein
VDPINRSRLRAVVDTAVDGVILMNAGGTVTMFNPACERIFGYAAEEIVGGDVKRLMPSPYRDEHDQYLENYQRTGERKIIGIGREVLGLRKSGEAFPMDLSVGKVEDDDEASYVGILRDVSERKRGDQLRERLIQQLTTQNEERERFVEQLAAKNEEQTHFLHAASHDLREPLRMIAAFCGRLSKNYGERLDERGAEYLQLSIAATARMTRLLDDLVELGRLGLEAERNCFFAASEVLDQVLDTFADPIRERRAEVSSGPLPRIYGNPIRFQGLMQNLIGNAMKYGAEGVVPHIDVASKREGEFWLFSVSDNGIGIAPRHYERIFEPFKRLHAKNRYEGSGLGLAICRKIVDGFGGAISVRSTEGEGSTFSFTDKWEGEASDGSRI